ncbi:glycosyltransferase, partial [Patescibacteria group bacterium]|nr:glycosyltransferase [Patescibacteria group bacterium]
MRIAQIAPPWVAVPPTGYGGIERIISTLTEELVRRGHDVTLFATGDSKTSGTLSSYYEKAIGNDGYKKGNAFTTLLHTFPA